MKTMRAGSWLPTMAAGMTHLATTRTRMQREAAERDALYASERWHKRRKNFLTFNPRCACGRPATVVDHRDGHRRPDWRARFFDTSTWQSMCSVCHAAKSAAELADWRRHGEG
jgi:hypothetical protein